MADIHLLSETGEPVVCSEERIAELITSGRLPPGTLYWREGMADWQPVTTFPIPVRSSTRPTEPIPAEALASVPPRKESASQRVALSPRSTGPTPAAPFAPPTKPPGRPRYRLRRDPWPLTIIVLLLLLTCLVITGLELATGAQELHRVASAPPALGIMQAVSESWNSSSLWQVEAKSFFSIGERTALDESSATGTGEVLEWSGWAANVLLLVPYLMWLYRTTVNCQGLSSNTHLQPGRVVGDYFIPFVNLFRPCQTMQEIWRVSRNPRGWLNDRGSILVGCWWVLLLVTIGVAIETNALFWRMQTRNDEVAAMFLFVVLKVIQAAWYATFLVLVTSIIHQQVRVVERSKKRSISSSSP